MAVIVLCLVGAGFSGLSETLRVTSLNLRQTESEPGATAKLEALVQNVSTLRQLNPDVILLQGVNDWQTCDRIAQRLRPAEYVVALCSAFREPATGLPAKHQLSILTRQKPYSFWSEPWRAGFDKGPPQGGFAFAAIQTGKIRIGFYCIELADDSITPAAVEQLLEHVNQVKRWEANRVQTVVLGGGFPAFLRGRQTSECIRILQDNGFADACFDIAPERKLSDRPNDSRAGTTTTYLLAERSAFGINPQEIISSGQLYVSSDLELDPAQVALGWPQRARELERRSAKASAGEQNTSAISAAVPSRKKGLPAWWWMPVGAIAGVLLVLALGRARRPRALPRSSQAALLPPPETTLSSMSSYTVVVSSQSIPDAVESDTFGMVSGQPTTHSARLDASGAGSEGTRSSSDPLRIDEPARARLLSDLSGWLKQKLLRRLLADRQNLLEAQNLAALKAKAVEERLSRIEQQIQQQTQSYEHRIEELTLELIAAREENRELIRARIAQVKLEMAGVREKILAQAQVREL